jgi:hypothetical protein
MIVRQPGFLLARTPSAGTAADEGGQALWRLACDLTVQAQWVGAVGSERAQREDQKN